MLSILLLRMQIPEHIPRNAVSLGWSRVLNHGFMGKCCKTSLHFERNTADKMENQSHMQCGSSLNVAAAYLERQRLHSELQNNPQWLKLCQINGAASK